MTAVERAKKATEELEAKKESLYKDYERQAAFIQRCVTSDMHIAFEDGFQAGMKWIQTLHAEDAG